MISSHLKTAKAGQRNNTDRIVLAEDRSPLFTHSDPREQLLELGKVQNLRVVAKLLNGLVISENETFSFWQHIGRPSRGKGFVEGRELRQGCLIPSVAGGICQFTNALAKVAHQSGMEVIEQHGHSASIDDSARRREHDATVFWNYVDFRFRAPFPVCLTAQLTQDSLLVRLERLQ